MIYFSAVVFLEIGDESLSPQRPHRRSSSLTKFFASVIGIF